MIASPIETLSFENTNLDFSHVQPAPTLRSVVELEAIEVGLCLIWREELIEASRLVRIELIHHNPDAVRIRVVYVCEFDHPIDPLCRASLLGDFDGYPSGQRLSGDVESVFPVAFVPVIDTSDRSRSPRERVAFVSTQCLAGLVKTDDRAISSYGS